MRYRLFTPAYEDLSQERLIRLRAARWPGARIAIRLWFALRVLSLVAACYRRTPSFLFVHPVRALVQAARALFASNRIMLRHDIRQAFRLLVHQPLFTAVAVLMLALGIGASTAIFSVINAVLLRPLPYPDAARLVAMSERREGELTAVSPVNFYDWQRDARSFEAMAIYADQQMTLAADDRAESIVGYAVSSSLFAVLDVRPRAGRWLRPEDDREGGPHSVVLSDGLWRRSFGADPAVIGRIARFDGSPYTIVGVAPPELAFPEGADAWFSLGLSAGDLAPNSRGAHWVSSIGRLRPGISREQANAEIAEIEARLAKADPKHVAGYAAEVTPLVEALVGPTATRALHVLFGAVGFLLLVACVNVSGLLMARAATRRTEMSLRAALGAGRIALLRQTMVEGLVLSSVAAVAGVFLSQAGTRALLAIVPTDLPRADAATLDPEVLLFASAVAVLSALLFSLLPATQSMTASVHAPLKDARSDTGLGGSWRVRATLVAAEVALVMVLLVGAALAIRSFDRLIQVSPGFDPRHVLTFNLSLPSGVYREDAQVGTFYQQLLDRFEALPGVIASGAVMIPPVSGSGFGGTFTIEGRPEMTGSREPRAQLRPVSPGYFRVLDIMIQRGRAFTSRDGIGALPVAMISETTARRFWPGENPVGKRLRMHVSAVGGREPIREIVGVVADVKTGPLEAPTAPVVYVPHMQHPSSFMALLIRGTGEADALSGSVRGALSEADRALVAVQMQPLEDHVAASRDDWRFRAVLLGLFAGSALFLALAGLYAVVAYATTQRRHELGVRVALGATRRDIVRLVTSEGMRPVMVGLLLGCGCAVLLSHAMTGLLFGTRPVEPGIIAAVALAFAAATALACYVPARRAAAQDPRDLLRAE